MLPSDQLCSASIPHQKSSDAFYKKAIIIHRLMGKQQPSIVHAFFLIPYLHFIYSSTYTFYKPFLSSSVNDFKDDHWCNIEFFLSASILIN